MNSNLRWTQGWYLGRPGILTRNDHQLGLMNGDVGITVPINEYTPTGEPRLRVAFRLPNGTIRLVLPSRLASVETAYAMTTHKAQGSEFSHTALVLPDQWHPLITRELVYTAVTRAIEQFTLLASDISVMVESIRRPTRRASGLAERASHASTNGLPHH